MSLLELPQERRFGSATHQIFVDLEDPDNLREVVGQLTERLPSPYVIWNSEALPLPNHDETVSLVSRPAILPFGGTPLTVLDGNLPETGSELAVDAGSRELLRSVGIDVELGAQLSIGGSEFSLVGIVEDPTDTNARLFIVAPQMDLEYTGASIVVEASDSVVFEALRDFPEAGWESFRSTDGSRSISIAVIYLLGAVGMLIVGLMCSAGFFVINQRRSRQYAVLRSIGASDSAIRLALLVSGAAVGLIGSAIGTLLAAAVFVAGRGFLENVVSHRVWLSDVPVATVLVPFGLAIATAALASLAPAHRVTRFTSLRGALQANNQPPSWNWLTAGLAGCGGAVSIVLALSPDRATTAVAATIGLASAIVAVRNFIWVARKLSERVSRPAGRVAFAQLGRDIAKVTAAVLALQIMFSASLGAALVSSAYARTADSQLQNLPENVAIIVPALGSSDPDRRPNLSQSLLDVIESRDGRVAELETAYDEGRIVEIAEPIGPDTTDPTVILAMESTGWIASDQLHEIFETGVSPSSGSQRLVSFSANEADIGGWSLDPSLRIQPGSMDGEGYASVPNTWFTEQEVRDRQFDRGLVGWAVALDVAIDEGLRSELFRLAGFDFKIEVPQPPERLPPIGLVGTAVSGSVASFTAIGLSILLRAESKGDLKVMSSIGFGPKSIRRMAAVSSTYLSAIAFALALLPAMLLFRAVQVSIGSIKFDVDWRLPIAFLLVSYGMSATASYLTNPD